MIATTEIASASGSEEPRLRVAPMHTVRGVMAILDRNEDQVLKLIASGHLSWAFDIAMGQKVREIRVLPASVILYQAGVPSRLNWEEIAASLVPDAAQARAGVVVALTSLDIQRILNASQRHVEELICCQQLKRIADGRRGPGGSCKVSAESFLGFLRKRRLR